MTRPRIFISTSMANSSARPHSHNCLAGKTVWKTLGDPHRHVAAGCRTNRLRSRKVDCFILRTAADHLAPLAIKTLYRGFHQLAYMAGVARALNLPLQIQQSLQAA